MAGVNGEMQSFINKFQQMNYDGFNTSLNFSSCQGTIYVSFYASLGQPIEQPHKSYSMKCSRGKPSRIRRRKKREESRQSEVTEHTSISATSDSLLDLDVPVFSNNSEDLEVIIDVEEERPVIIDVEEDDRSTQVSDSNFDEHSCSRPPSVKAVPENHLQASTTKALPQEDSKYWDQMSAMLRYLVEKSSQPSSIKAKTPAESRPFHVQSMQQPTSYPRCESKNPEVCSRPIVGRPFL